jgi:hypothetical protein
MAIINPLGHLAWINLPSIREDESRKSQMIIARQPFSGP